MIDKVESRGNNNLHDKNSTNKGLLIILWICTVVLFTTLGASATYFLVGGNDEKSSTSGEETDRADLEFEREDLEFNGFIFSYIKSWSSTIQRIEEPRVDILFLDDELIELGINHDFADISLTIKEGNVIETIKESSCINNIEKVDHTYFEVTKYQYSCEIAVTPKIVYQWYDDSSDQTVHVYCEKSDEYNDEYDQFVSLVKPV